MSDLGLPAAGADLDLGNVVIDKAALPYVQEWYADLQQAGDTPMKFLLRMIYQQAIIHRASKLKSADGDTHRTAHDGYVTDVDTDEATLLGQIELVLP
jgi:hypothetical protein